MRMKQDDPLAGREVYLEMHRVGGVVKVTAVDAATSIEASISGPANTPEYILKANAGKRLAYVLRKEGYID